MMDFEAVPDAHLRQHGAYRGMLYFADFLYVLDVRVNYAMLVVEERRQASHTYEAVPVNSKAEHAAPVFAVPGWIVRAAPEQGHPKRCARDYHLSPAHPPAVCGRMKAPACT